MISKFVRRPSLSHLSLNLMHAFFQIVVVGSPAQHAGTNFEFLIFFMNIFR